MYELIKNRVQPDELPVLSASSINMYLKDPAAWVLKHFYGVRTESNIYAARGTAVEACIVATTPEEAAEAMSVFDEAVFLSEDTELAESIGFDISGWVSEGKKALSEIKEKCGEVTFQKELTGEIEGLPFTGFLDFSFESMDVDLKTANELPSIVSRGPRKGMLPATKKDNARQQAIYNALTGKETALLFVSPDDYLLHRLTQEELSPLLDEVKVAVTGIKDLLSKDIDGILGSVTPDWSKMRYSFYWDQAATELAQELWEAYDI